MTSQQADHEASYNDDYLSLNLLTEAGYVEPDREPRRQVRRTRQPLSAPQASNSENLHQPNARSRTGTDQHDYPTPPLSRPQSQPQPQPQVGRAQTSTVQRPNPALIMNRPRAERRGEAARLVIALDYGTTYTGFALSYTMSNDAKLDEIEVLRDWGGSMANEEKIPSVSAYPQPIEWGSDVSDDATTMVNMKLELDVLESQLEELLLTLQVLEGTDCLNFEYISSLDSEPEYSAKSPSEIVTDYLTKIFEKVFDTMRKRYGEVRNKWPVDIVFTVPVKWSYQATNLTFRAIQQAGFNEVNFPCLNQIIAISEPEAASHFAVRQFIEQDKNSDLRVGDIYILCDAGGGTVDLVSFQIKKMEPRIELERVTDPTSGKCGSAYVNTFFLRWLRKVIGPADYSILDPSNSGQRFGTHSTESALMRKLLARFEVEKRAFTKRSGDIHIRLPEEEFKNLTILPYVKHGEITIPPDIMRKQIFDKCVNKVIELIQEQALQVESKKQQEVKDVFLVGGFGQSQYLRDQLLKSLEFKEMSLRQLSNLNSRGQHQGNSMTAVVQGSVIYGIEKARHNVVTIQKAACAYGIVVDEPFSIYKYGSRDYYRDPLSNAELARKQFAWLVRKGDAVPSNGTQVAEKEFTMRFEVGKGFKLRLKIYSCDNEPNRKLPLRWETGQHAVVEIGYLKHDFQNIPQYTFETKRNDVTGKEYHVAYLVCVMRIIDSHLNVVISDHGKTLCQVSINVGSKNTSTAGDDHQDGVSPS